MSIVLIPSSILLVLFHAYVYEPFLIIGYVMFDIAAIAAIVFGIIKMTQDPKFAKKTLYIVGGLVVVFIIAYGLADGEVLNSYEKYKITIPSSKLVGTGIIACYILSIGAIGAIAYAELSKAFSK